MTSATLPLFQDFAHIYLSPHLDDAVLSCGGRIHQQAARGERVLVATICAGDPPPGPLSDFARSLHERWGLGDSACEARRAEDLSALATLGAEALHLPLPDAIYRRDRADGPHLYPSRDLIFGLLDPREWWLSLDVAALLAKSGPLRPETRLYAPIGLGGHVDHQLTWHVAEGWAGGRPDLFVYEDYPYSHDQSAVQWWVEGRHWMPDTVRLTEADLDRKIAAVAAYRSQISTFWPDEATMAAAVRQHAGLVGEGQGPAERTWQKAGERLEIGDYL